MIIGLALIGTTLYGFMNTRSIEDSVSHTVTIELNQGDDLLVSESNILLDQNMKTDGLSTYVTTSADTHKIYRLPRGEYHLLERVHINEREHFQLVYVIID